jgi:hypothetical protein
LFQSGPVCAALIWVAVTRTVTRTPLASVAGHSFREGYGDLQGRPDTILLWTTCRLTSGQAGRLAYRGGIRKMRPR